MCKQTVVVGLGAICENHINPVLKYSSLYGVCDIAKEKAEKYSEKYNCKAFFDYDEMIKDENVTTVHICTPHFLHFPMAKAAILAKKEVVLEKPAVMNMDEFYELEKLSEDSKCMIVLQNRYNPCVKYIKENWDNIGLGKLLGLKGLLFWYRSPEYYNESDWRGKYKTEGGGLLINQAPHILDLLQYFGGEIEKIEGNSYTRFLSDIIEVEDTTEGTIFFKSGINAYFYGTNGFPINNTMDIELIFENGSLRYDYNRLFKVVNGEIETLETDTAVSGEKSYWGAGHNDIIKKFYETEDDFPKISDYEPVAKIIDFLVKRKD